MKQKAQRHRKTDRDAEHTSHGCDVSDAMPAMECELRCDLRWNAMPAMHLSLKHIGIAPDA